MASIKERSPEVHLFIEMPHDAVDVNVHPTKAEVRFRDQSFIHELVRRTLGDALGRGPAPELQLDARAGSGQPQPSTLPLPTCVLRRCFPSRWTVGASAPTREATCSHRPAKQVRTDDGGPIAPTTDRIAPGIRPMMALGQFRDTFIIAVDEEGIAIIDQHVAHERILFERITERLTSGQLEASACSSRCSSRCRLRRRQALPRTRSGARVDSGSRLRSSAAIRCASLRFRRCSHARTATSRCARSPTISRPGPGIESRRRDQTHRGDDGVSRRSQGNYPLTTEKMAHILEELRRTAYSTICPHGRPVMLRLTRREVEKNFQRI